MAFSSLFSPGAPGLAGRSARAESVLKRALLRQCPPIATAPAGGGQGNGHDRRPCGSGEAAAINAEQPLGHALQAKSLSLRPSCESVVRDFRRTVGFDPHNGEKVVLSIIAAANKSVVTFVAFDLHDHISRYS